MTAESPGFAMAGEQQTAALALAAFQNTPWKRVLEHSAEHDPSGASAVFRGLTGLYWAYARDLSPPEELEHATKNFLTDLAQQQTGNHPRQARDAHDVYAICDHLLSFATMWHAVQGQIVPAKPKPRHLVEALHTDAASRLDSLCFEGRLNAQLDLFAVQTGLSIEFPNGLNALTRHFTDSAEAPPVTVPSPTLTAVLAHMQNRYSQITRLPGYPPNPTGQKMMREVIGSFWHSNRTISVRELLLHIPDADAQATALDHLEQELAALTGTTLAPQLRQARRGQVALASTGVEIDMAVSSVDEAETSTAEADDKTKASVETLNAVHEEAADETSAEPEKVTNQTTDKSLVAEETEETEAEVEDTEDEATPIDLDPQENEQIKAIEEGVDLWTLVETTQTGGGDRNAAFGELYKVTRKLIFGYLYRRTSNPDLAEDLTAEVYARAFKSIDNLENRGSSVMAWLTRIARNTMASHFRLHANRYTAPTDDMEVFDRSTSDADLSPMSGLGEPESAVMQNELGRILTELIKTLPERQRICLGLRFHGLSLMETATEMGVEYNSARTLEQRAFAKLRTLIGDAHPTIIEDFLGRRDNS